MTNKIQISTVHKEADVQVIELNAQFIARIVEGEILTKGIMANLKSLENACDEDTPAIKIDAPTFTYWRIDIEKVWNLLSDVKQAFLCEDKATTSPSL